MNKETTVAGHTYNIAKMPLIKQFHVSRILSPLIFSGPKPEVVGMHAAVVAALFRLPDKEAEQVVDSCLDTVQRKQPEHNVYAKIGSLRAPMFDDIQLQEYYELTAHCVVESLGNFFPAVLSKITEKAPATKE